ncbi:hypothetical protein QUB24_26980 [Microcoleus sp. B9-D4]
MVRGLTKVRSKAERHVCAKLGDRANWYNQRQHQRFHGSNAAFDRSPKAATASGNQCALILECVVHLRYPVISFPVTLIHDVDG